MNFLQYFKSKHRGNQTQEDILTLLLIIRSQAATGACLLALIVFVSGRLVL